MYMDLQTLPPDIVGEGFGRWEIKRLLGGGGFAWVFLGEDARIGREVAIKILKPSTSGEYPEGVKERFFLEARMTASLHCEHTVHIYELGEDEHEGQTYLYIVSEYIRGRTLDEHLDSVGRLTPFDVVLLMQQVARSLYEAHNKGGGFIHRDLKPANIMVFEKPLEKGVSIKVLDYGIGKALKQGTEWDRNLTLEGELLISPWYAAPEQILPDLGEIGPYTDFYALGVLVYECLVGHHPFPDVKEAARMIAKTISSNSITLPEEWQDCPLAPIIHKLLVKDVRLRYQNCEELLDDLEHLELSETRHRRAQTPTPTPAAARVDPETRREQPARETARVASSDGAAPAATTPMSDEEIVRAHQEPVDPTNTMRGKPHLLDRLDIKTRPMEAFDPLEDRPTDPYEFRPPSLDELALADTLDQVPKAPNGAARRGAVGQEGSAQPSRRKLGALMAIAIMCAITLAVGASVKLLGGAKEQAPFPAAAPVTSVDHADVTSDRDSAREGKHTHTPPGAGGAAATSTSPLSTLRAPLQHPAGATSAPDEERVTSEIATAPASTTGEVEAPATATTPEATGDPTRAGSERGAATTPARGEGAGEEKKEKSRARALEQDRKKRNTEAAPTKEAKAAPEKEHQGGDDAFFFGVD